MALHISSPPAFVVLELASCCPKRVAQRDVWVLVRRVGWTGPMNRDLLFGKCDVYSELITRTLLAVGRQWLYNDVTALNVFAEFFESCHELPDARLECW